MSSISDLAGKYAGQVGYIVGKGPSLQWLAARHFPARAAPVIALNDAILKVQDLGLSNPIYSLQKDGCGAGDAGEQCRPDCGNRGHMVYPKDESITLIQQRRYSPYCLPRHKNKIWIEHISEIGIKIPSEMAVIMGIEILRLMGCGKMVLIACDSLADPDELRTFDPRSGTARRTGAGTHYRHAYRRILGRLKKTEYHLIVPEAKHGN